MLAQILIGSVMLGTTVALLGVMIVVATDWLLKHPHAHAIRRSLPLQITLVSFMSLWLALGLLIVMALWATVLYVLGLFDTFYQSMYFSMIAFTTLGFGDYVLPLEWGLLSGFIATDGFILFGLGTAFVFEVLRQLRDTAER